MPRSDLRFMIFSFIFCSTEIYIIWTYCFHLSGFTRLAVGESFSFAFRWAVTATNYKLERVPSSQVVQIRVWSLSGGPCGPAQSQLLPFTNQRSTGLNLKSWIESTAPNAIQKPKRTWHRQNTEICQWGVATVSELVAALGNWQTKPKRSEMKRNDAASPK